MPHGPAATPFRSCFKTRWGGSCTAAPPRLLSDLPISDRHPHHRGKRREQQPTGPHHGGRPGSQPAAKSKNRPPPPSARIPGDRPKPQLQQHQRTERGLAQNQCTQRDCLRVERRQNGRHHGRTVVEQQPREPPYGQHRQSAQQRRLCPSQQHRRKSVAGQPQDRRQQHRIARHAEHLGPVRLIDVRPSFGDGQTKRPVAFAVAHAEAAVKPRLPRPSGRQAKRQGQHQHHDQLLPITSGHYEPNPSAGICRKWYRGNGSAGEPQSRGLVHFSAERRCNGP